VGLANLDIIEREGLIERVRALEPAVGRAMKPLADHPLVAEVRAGIGLLAAVEVTQEALAERPDLMPTIVREIRARGVLTRALQGRSLQFSPPFVVTDPEVDRIASVYAEGLDAVLR
jgi:adenosylmethionine-8-amino-7-oxononanoate aminotransferase